MCSEIPVVIQMLNYLRAPIPICQKFQQYYRNAGISFNLPGIKLFADYTFQDYNSLTIGASIGIR